MSTPRRRPANPPPLPVRNDGRWLLLGGAFAGLVGVCACGGLGLGIVSRLKLPVQMAATTPPPVDVEPPPPPEELHLPAVANGRVTLTADEWFHTQRADPAKVRDLLTGARVQVTTLAHWGSDGPDEFHVEATGPLGEPFRCTLRGEAATFAEAFVRNRPDGRAVVAGQFDPESGQLIDGELLSVDDATLDPKALLAAARKQVQKLPRDSYSAQAVTVMCGTSLTVDLKGRQTREDALQALRVLGGTVGPKGPRGAGQGCDARLLTSRRRWLAVFGEPQNVRDRAETLPVQTWKLKCRDGVLTFAGSAPATGDILLKRVYLFDN